jgi:nardilysin
MQIKTYTSSMRAAVPVVSAQNPFVSSACVYRIRPVKRIHRLYVSWALPPLLSLYRCKPNVYIEHLLGHEGSGSLLSSLKAEGLATGIWAGVGSDGYHYSSAASMFVVEIELTLRGVSQWTCVVEKLFGVRSHDAVYH